MIFVSDHGMDNTSSSSQVYLENYINSSSYFLSESGPLVHLWPHPGMKDAIYENLTRNPIPHIRKVFKKEDIPAEYHWKENRRIPPIFIDPEVGWVVLRSRSDSPFGQGEHGWPPVESKSYSIFYARGPAFKEGVAVEPFNTVDLYPLMCKLLRINPRPNNGSLDNVKALLKEDIPPARSSGTVQYFACSKLGLIILFPALGLFGQNLNY